MKKVCIPDTEGSSSVGSSSHRVILVGTTALHLEVTSKGGVRTRCVISANPRRPTVGFREASPKSSHINTSVPNRFSPYKQRYNQHVFELPIILLRTSLRAHWESAPILRCRLVMGSYSWRW